PAPDLAGAVRALAACSHLLAWCGSHGGPGYREAVGAFTRDAGRELTAGELYYEVSAAADRLGAVLPEGGLQ
ncbi:MAG: hypothetical protein J2P25_26215, partial [Nocardiopsaceae bacterium]|nr:hypothetical protein [Nocardiopsaceae bacterium]